MNIIPDLVLTATLMVPFLVLVFGLNAILYKPMLAYLEARKQATVGAREEAKALELRAAGRVTEWEAALARARAEVTEYRAQRRAVAQAGYARVVADARGQADARITEALAQVRAEAATARLELDGTARALSRDVAATVLGRPLQQMEA